MLTVTRKGGRRQNLPIAPWVGIVVDVHLNGRGGGPLFATWPRSGGHGRMDEPANGLDPAGTYGTDSFPAIRARWFTEKPEATRPRGRSGRLLCARV